MSLAPEFIQRISRIEGKRHVKGLKSLVRFFANPDAFPKKTYEYITTLDDDLLVRCDLGSFIEWNIFFFGYYEPEVIHLLKRIIKKGDVCFDIGANMGCHTLPLAKYAGEHGKVYAFEPNKYILEKLHFNIHLNGLKNISVEEYGVGTHNGEVSFYEDNSNHNEGMSSLHKEYLREPVEVKIHLKTLESIIETKGIQKIDFMNIDIEGEDLELLKHSAKVINTMKPKILFEWLGDDISWMQDVFPHYDFYMVDFETYGLLKKFTFKKHNEATCRMILMISR